ncbi:unnamed protein product [Polarella glacialis]|uniref:Uncharacterized protein n=1 Tax=Polarella glacialis TaxID=89957 RepID=A0A813GK78_POLGL|nr:unnamed protein product [Polarella glacialis]
MCGQMRPLRIWAVSDLAHVSYTKLDPIGPVRRPGLASPHYLEAHAASGAVFKAGDFQDYLATGVNVFSDYTLLELVVFGGHVELASLMKANEPTRTFETSFHSPFGFLGFNAGTQTFHVHPAALDVLDILGIGCSSLKFRNEGSYSALTCSQCYEHVDVYLRGQSFLFLAILLCDFTQVARMSAGGADLSIGDSLDQLLNEQSWNQALCVECRVHVRFPYDSLPGLRWRTIEVALSSAFHSAFGKVKKFTATAARGGFVQQMNLMTPLAHKIFGFASELPTGLQRLPSHCLFSLDKDPLLLESVLSGAASGSTEPSHGQADQSLAFASEESAAPLPPVAEEEVLAEEALSKEDDLGLAAAMQQSEAEALSQEQQEVHKALLLSKEETFSNDHVVLWRLTKCSARISDALSTSEELRACHDRVLEAGCELTPKWAGGAVLLVPLTLELYQELGLKFAPYHVLSLSSDRERLLAALMSFPSKKRPTVSSDHRAALLHTGDLSGISGGSGGVGLDQQAFEESDQEENDEVGRSEVSEAEEGRSQRQPPCHTVTTLEIVRTFLDFPLPRDVFEASSSGLVRSAPEVSWGRGEDESRQGNQQCGGGGGGILSSNPRRWGGKSLGRSAGQKKGA